MSRAWGRRSLADIEEQYKELAAFKIWNVANQAAEAELNTKISNGLLSRGLSSDEKIRLIHERAKHLITYAAEVCVHGNAQS